MALLAPCVQWVATSHKQTKLNSSSHELQFWAGRSDDEDPDLCSGRCPFRLSFFTSTFSL